VENLINSQANIQLTRPWLREPHITGTLRVSMLTIVFLQPTLQRPNPQRVEAPPRRNTAQAWQEVEKREII